MNFLVDAQLPPALCRWLAARGHRAIHVTERGAALPDAVIAQWAEAGALILVSKDEDFLTLQLPDRFALLWLRCGNATNKALAVWLDRRWAQIEALLAGGERVIEVV